MSKRVHTSRPCKSCPFRRDGEGATPVRLHTARIHEILAAVSPEDGGGGRFPCHGTVDYDTLDEDTGTVDCKETLECVGALILAYRQDNPVSNFIRVMERIGGVDEALATGEWPEVFDTIDEMLTTALDAKQPRKARRR